MRERKKKYENIKELRKKEKGITLVALIITIIVLLILAGVSISFVFNGGILDKTQSAVNEYENAADEEKNVLDKIDKYLEDKLPKIPEVDENGLAVENTTIVAKDDKNIQIVIPKGFAPVILNSNRMDSMPGEDGAVKNIMPNDQWINITKKDINKGIVVVDHAITYDNGQATGIVPDFNEYVWIPIINSDKFAINSWEKYTLADTATKNAYWEETNSLEYTNMVDSINTNKGFFISRYEASMNSDNTTAQSKRNQIVIREIKQQYAITASNNMNPSIHSHLIYGVEWDSILQWLLDSDAIISSSTSGRTKTIEIEDIKDDSSSWGNYGTSKGDAANKAGTMQNTGASEYWKANNIYDLAGNAYEYTQENKSTDIYCAVRGGHCGDKVNIMPAAFRYTVADESNYNVVRI